MEHEVNAKKKLPCFGRHKIHAEAHCTIITMNQTHHETHYEHTQRNSTNNAGVRLTIATWVSKAELQSLSCATGMRNSATHLLRLTC